MRRFSACVIAGIAALTMCAATGWWEPAGAHICPFTSKIPVGKPSTSRMYVTVEGTAIPDVEMELPAGLELQEVTGAPAGWTYSRKDQTLRFRGPASSPYTCVPFDLTIVAPEKGVFPVGITQRDAKGKIIARSTTDPDQGGAHPGFSPLVYAGVKPPSPPGSGISVTMVIGIVLLSLGVILGLVQFARARRACRAGEREDELQSRLDEFKKQTRDRQRERSEP